MRDPNPKTILLSDYAVPDYLVSELELDFDLRPGATTVIGTLTISPNPASTAETSSFRLDGEELELTSISIDGKELEQNEYTVDETGLTLLNPPSGEFKLQTTSIIHPEDNTALEGLYQSSGNYCTQCEAQGFRKITFYPDRPDVMAKFKTTIHADKKSFPVLLSNGNPMASGDEENGRHWTTWQDPFPKPAYLFALVAGDLALTEGSFKTASGRDVALQVFTEHHNADKTQHAIDSLARAMKWDEETFGLEYDLDIYMIVAVDDFNMGAMENKGLNIFNSKYVLALPETATDTDFTNIEAVVAHEYFHNWTGNRVTCRDWFQLSLKEGLTVFRDQEFTADMTSASVKRIDDVQKLRSSQFAEDAGPMAHPIRPESYIEINNFYTLTVYEKGAEVVRLYQTLLGKDGFRKGMDLYFERHDGQAVTTDDFRQAMADANNVNLDQLTSWYSQAGTPSVRVLEDWKEEAGEYTLIFAQSCRQTPETSEKKPFLIPIRLGLLDQRGSDMPLNITGEDIKREKSSVILQLRETSQEFKFTGLTSRPTPSFARGFSAPIHLRFEYSDDDLAFLMHSDSDDFNRWNAGQSLAVKGMLENLYAIKHGKAMSANSKLIEGFRHTLENRQGIDRSFLAVALSLPSESYLAELVDVVEPDNISQVHQHLARTVATELEPLWLAIYEECSIQAEFTLDHESMGRRRLRNLALAYLCYRPSGAATALKHFKSANNMTDSIGALVAINDNDGKERDEMLSLFEKRWNDNALVMDKFFALQASANIEGVTGHIQTLMNHPAFSIRNPNKVRALIGSFAMANPVQFHAADGFGYKLVIDKLIELNEINPQVAARVSKAFTNWRRFDENRQMLMKCELERLRDTPNLSRDVFEIVERALGDS